jgi:hypothetical protein
LAAALAVAVAATAAGVLPAYAAVEGPVVPNTSVSHERVEVIDRPLKVAAQNALAPLTPTTPPDSGEYNLTPTISGTAAVGQTLSLETGTWPPGTTFIYRWYADGASLSGVTGSTLVLGPEHAGKAITVHVIGSWSTLGGPSVQTYADTEATAMVADGTLTGSTPAVSGTATVGRTLSVDTGIWTEGTTFEYQWLADDTPIVGATGSNLVVIPDHGGKAIEARVTGSKPGYMPESRTSEPTAKVAYEATPAEVTFTDKNGTKDDRYTVPATAGVDYLVGGKVVPAGTYRGAGTLVVYPAAQEGYRLAPSTPIFWGTTFMSTPYLTASADVTFTDLDGTGASSNSYTIPVSPGVDYVLDDKVIPAGTYPGKGSVTIAASARPDYILLPMGNTSWTHTFPANVFPVDLSQAHPVVAGQLPIAPPAVVFVDAVGTANDSYSIPSTTGVDYLVGGKVVSGGTYPGTGTVTVTAKAQTGYVLAPGAPASWTATFKDSLAGPAPRINGTAKVGYTLTANPGTWSPSPVTLRYQWYRAGIAIVGATAATYKPTTTDAGATLTVRVIASKTGYTTVGKPSAPTAAVAKDSLTGPAPWITGTAKVGYTLTANPGTWSPSPVTLRYQWYRAGIAIVGATAASYKPTTTAASYKPTTTDAGAALTVRVIASKTGYTTVGKSSAATAEVAKDSLAGPAPRITGTAKVGYTLTANPGTWSPSPVTLRYQWYRAGIAIVGATAASYKPTTTDAGAAVTVRVIASKTGYTTVGKSSAPTAAVAKDSLTGPAPWITGVFEVGYSLTANPGTWSPSPVTLRYQWYRSKVAIVGATDATYVLAAADAGATITVKVIASKSGYTTAGVTSPATLRIASGYVPPAPAPYVPPAPAPYEPPAPAPYEPPAPAPVAYYANCDAVRAAGAAPLYASQPGYRAALDRDRDGIACE